MVEINGKKINLPKPEMMVNPRYISKQVDKIMFDLAGILPGIDNATQVEIREVLINQLAKVVNDTNYMNVWQEYQRIDKQIETFHADLKKIAMPQFYRPGKKGGV